MKLERKVNDRTTWRGSMFDAGLQFGAGATLGAIGVIGVIGIIAVVIQAATWAWGLL